MAVVENFGKELSEQEALLSPLLRLRCQPMSLAEECALERLVNTKLNCYMSLRKRCRID